MQLLRPKRDKTGTFKVISYNVHMFNHFQNAAGSQKNVMNFIKSQNPDIICLQEFFIAGDPSKAGQMVNSGTGIKYNSHMKMLGSGKNRYYGIATFSRFPIVRKGEIIHPDSSSLSIYTDVIIAERHIQNI